MTGQMRRRALLLFLLASSLADSSAEVFRFRYTSGDQYRILSRGDQHVYINGVFSHRADILNRIAVTIKSVDEGAGRLAATFQTSERAYDDHETYEWAEEYQSEYSRDAFGAYEIDPDLFMPVVRNVPVFPEREIAIGERWAGVGEEVHDFRANFGLEEAYRFPIDVSYEYLGVEELNGDPYHLISIRYAVFHKASSRDGPELYPIRIAGFSNQILYWDSYIGRPYHYSEEYDFLVTLSSGDEVEYVGTAEATVVEATSMRRDALAAEIQTELERAEVDDARVTIADSGVTVSLENIQFLPDSSVLRTSEKKKLDVIAEILSRYPERDILVTGHTALAGTEAGRLALSEERAKSVGRYLFELGIRSREQIVTRGFGATRPIAGNDTPEGMSRNRRVEITILEN